MEMSEAISKIMAGRLGSLIEWKSWAPSRCHTMTCITLMKWVKFVKWNYQGLLQLGDTWFSKSFFPMASKRICKAQIGLSAPLPPESMATSSKMLIGNENSIILSPSQSVITLILCCSGANATARPEYSGPSGNFKIWAELDVTNNEWNQARNQQARQIAARSRCRAVEGCSRHLFEPPPMSSGLLN